MIRWLLHRGARAFGTRQGYDTGYMHHVIDVSKGAGLRLALFPVISQYRGPRADRGVWAGALLASTLDGDCGPCAQLVVDMCIAAGMPPDLLIACLEGDMEAAGDLGLGYRFARAAIADLPQADTLGRQIAAKHGEQTLVASSFAAATGRFYPVFKRGLGRGQTCVRVRAGGRDIAVAEKA